MTDAVKTKLASETAGAARATARTSVSGVTPSSGAPNPSRPSGSAGDGAPVSPNRRRWQAVAQRFRTDKGMWLSAAYLAAMVIGSIVVLFIDADPNAIDVTAMLQGPSAEHWLGTDELGRDYFLRVWHGAGVTLLVGVLAMLGAVLIGVVVGVLAGYYGGWLDSVLMRIVDVFCSIPWIIMVTVVSLLFVRGLVSIIIVIGLFGWMEVARIVRAETMGVKNRDYVAYAELIGTPSLLVVVRHVLPGVLPVIITASTATIASAIMVESSLSFLGMGVQAPMASWGSLLQAAQGNLAKAPLMAIVPGLLIVLTILAFNKLGELARVFVEPRSAQSTRKQGRREREAAKARKVAGAYAAQEATTAAPLSPAAGEPSLLSLRHLTVSFPVSGSRKEVVHDVSLAVRKDEILGIVGESGSGKSVTMKSILGLLPPNADIRAEAVDFAGDTLLGLTERQMQGVRGAKIAMVFQDPMTSLSPLKKIGAQLIEVIRRHQGLSRAEARKEAVELLRQVGIPAPEQRLGNYPHQLSGGQRQRVLIALALACKPSLLVADEPTTALDVTTQAQILDLIRHIHESKAMPVILISHDIGVMARMCDRIIVMRNGSIVEEGPSCEIFEHPREAYTRSLLQAAREQSLHSMSEGSLSSDGEPEMENSLVEDAKSGEGPEGAAANAKAGEVPGQAATNKTPAEAPGETDGEERGHDRR